MTKSDTQSCCHGAHYLFKFLFVECFWQVFPQFLETCRDHLATIEGNNIADFDEFSTNCLDLEGVALVEYAIELLDAGCHINLGGLTAGGQHRRQLQYLAQRFSSGNEECGWDQLDDFAADVDQVCCGRDGTNCPEGTPSSCSAACAVSLHQFTTKCDATLEIAMPAEDPFRAQITAFETSCMETVTRYPPPLLLMPPSST
eukprot:SAG11_NODE_2638_length_3142_cov_17.327637_2_plen_201_part_00